VDLSIWLVCSEWDRKRHRGRCHLIRRKCCSTWLPFYARISKERTRCYTTINLGSIRRWSATYQVGFDDNRYYWNGTNWGTIYTQQLSQCEMIASLIAPNVGQESRGYVVGTWRNHTKSIITWNCIYFIAKVDGWLQKYGMIPPTWYIQPSSHTTTLTAAGYEQSTEYNIVYMHSTYMRALDVMQRVGFESKGHILYFSTSFIVVPW